MARLLINIGLIAFEISYLSITFYVIFLLLFYYYVFVNELLSSKSKQTIFTESSSGKETKLKIKCQEQKERKKLNQIKQDDGDTLSIGLELKDNRLGVANRHNIKNNQETKIQLRTGIHQ